MNAPRCTPTGYISSLVATLRAVSGTGAVGVQPRQLQSPAHGAFTRLLHRFEPDPAMLWQEVAPLVQRERGVPVVDDSTTDKPYARKTGLLTRHWSGKHWRVVQGMNRLTLLSTDGRVLVPYGYRLCENAVDRLSKNGHFRAALSLAEARGLNQGAVAFDGWYAAWPISGRPELRLAVADATPGDPSGQPRQRWQLPTRRGRRRGDGHEGAAARVWLRAGLLDRPHRREHEVLGDQRPGHDGGAAAEVRGGSLGDRVLPSRPQASLRHRAGRGTRGPRAVQPHRLLQPRRPAAGAASAGDRRQLVGGQDQHHPRGRALVPGPSALHPALDGNCVSPNPCFLNIRFEETS